MKKNSGKAPSIQFYYKDFLADMQEHNPEIVGAWMLVLIKIWHENDGGKITKTLEQFAKIMQTDTARVIEFIEYFSAENIADVTRENGKITVINRRSKRDIKLREQNKLRQKTFRDKRNSNGDVIPEKVNPSISTSISTSISKDNNNTNTNINYKASSEKKEGEIGIDKFSSEDVLGLDLLIKKEAQKCISAIQLNFSFTTVEARTFARVIKWLGEQCSLPNGRRLGLDIFDHVIEWSKQARASSARNKKGLLMEKIKRETGYKASGMLLESKVAV